MGVGFVGAVMVDAVVVDIQYDYFKECFGDVRKGRADSAALKDGLELKNMLCYLDNCCLNRPFDVRES